MNCCLSRCFAPLGALTLLLLTGFATPLHAQLPKIFVASFGNDANDGTRNAPKRNFQAAHDAVAAGGQIVALDTAGYGKLNITKSLDVTVPPGVNGFVTVANTGGFFFGVNIAVGANSTVSLRGLIIETTGQGGYGILTNNLGNLSVEDCTVSNFGIGIATASISPEKLYLRNCTVRGCNTGLGLGSQIGATVSAIATDCRFEQNGVGATASSVSSGNFDYAADLTLADCVISGNTTGVQASNTVAVVRLDNCAVTGNATGVSVANSGQVLSRGNNTLENNAAGNTFPGAYSAK